MKLLVPALAALLIPTTATFALANEKHEHGTSSVAATTTPAAMADAEVRKVDKEAGKVTLKHGEIKNLDMPPMTMVFRVSDAAMLAQLKAGDKIRFAADKVNGQYTVTKLEVTK